MLFMIAVHRTSNKKGSTILGFRLLDLGAWKTMDVSKEDVINGIASGRVRIENLSVVKGRIVERGNCMSRYPVIINGNLVPSRIVTIVGKQDISFMGAMFGDKATVVDGAANMSLMHAYDINKYEQYITNLYLLTNKSPLATFQINESAVPEYTV